MNLFGFIKTGNNAANEDLQNLEVPQNEPQQEQQATERQPAPQKAEAMVCPVCGKELIKERVKDRKYVCYECGYYFRVRAKNRIRMVTDPKSFEPWYEELETENPLDFPEYEQKVAATREKTKLSEAVMVGKAKIYGQPTVIGVIDARFLMGSMGHVVGERITLAVEKATELGLPVIMFCCSGGARMQEGIVSLMQMA